MMKFLTNTEEIVYQTNFLLYCLIFTMQIILTVFTVVVFDVHFSSYFAYNRCLSVNKEFKNRTPQTTVLLQLPDEYNLNSSV